MRKRGEKVILGARSGHRFVACALEIIFHFFALRDEARRADDGGDFAVRIDHWTEDIFVIVAFSRRADVGR